MTSAPSPAYPQELSRSLSLGGNSLGCSPTSAARGKPRQDVLHRQRPRTHGAPPRPPGRRAPRSTQHHGAVTPPAPEQTLAVRGEASLVMARKITTFMVATMSPSRPAASVGSPLQAKNKASATEPCREHVGLLPFPWVGSDLPLPVGGAARPRRQVPNLPLRLPEGAQRLAGQGPDAVRSRSDAPHP